MRSARPMSTCELCQQHCCRSALLLMVAALRSRARNTQWTRSRPSQITLRCASTMAKTDAPVLHESTTMRPATLLHDTPLRGPVSVHQDSPKRPPKPRPRALLLTFGPRPYRRNCPRGPTLLKRWAWSSELQGSRSNIAKSQIAHMNILVGQWLVPFTGRAGELCT